MLNELRETEFFASSQMDVGDTTSTKSIKEDRDPAMEVSNRARSKRKNPVGEGYDCIHHVESKIATTPILNHFDPDRIPVIVVYASNWAVSASLLQEYDGVHWTVTFVDRKLKPNEI